ncbi:MAG TPA: hypothetical protein VKE27_04370, partial [Candidatus Dormibacteraeota bacterium]|nr:hypothetical protein [Candidatus Dormibacteraeota bacterium]
FYTEAHARLKPGGIMLMWIPYLATLDEFKTHVRTFRSVFPHVDIVLSPVKNGAYLLGSDEPLNFDAASLASLLGSPAAASDFATAPDDPHLDGAAWAREIMADVWMQDEQIDQFVGAGPVITDDRPISEYWLLHALSAKDHADVNDQRLRGYAVARP